MGFFSCCCDARSEDFRGSPTEEFHAKYEFTGDILGCGSFSEVKKAVLKKDLSKAFAVKIVKKAGLNRKELDASYTEVSVLKKLDHSNIAKLYDFYENSKFIYMVCEFIPGGELLARIEKKAKYSEEDAKQVVRTLAMTLKFCYERGIVHRDIKAENILLRDSEDDADIVLVDFGFAYQQPPELQSFKLLQSQLGTPSYVAPEVLSSRPYNFKCDVWSLGVLTYILLSGNTPFYARDTRILFEKIRKANFTFTPADTWDHVSDSAKDLIRNMLEKDPDSRYDYDQILNSKWITEVTPNDITASLKALKKFNAKRKFLAVATAAAAATLFDEMMRASNMSLEDAQKAEDVSVITTQDLKAREKEKGEFPLSRDLKARLDELLQEN